ncbi:type 1 glutamine amidotransferase [Leucobacter triazinivorans]|uniref:type 1 glutamine amidotransferase n=1 Tax=Leucobacter triazinivorans TaxID=1784719 RepID=UPI0013EE5E73|nr:type 1 glutamine amidotransferase [Leucobacter triazinivorans]
MSGARVLVVEHQENAGIGLFGERIAAQGVVLETVGPDAGAEVPASLDGYDGLIVLGGSMGPTDDGDAPWLPATRRLLVEGVARGVPTLGICLGAQLLVTATGGRVREAVAGPEVGLHTVSFAADAAGDPLFDGLAASDAVAVQWHYLEAGELPAGARLLASSGPCRNQAFRIGEAAWGVQFHPEALGGTARDWVDEDRQGLVDLGLAEDAVVDEVLAAEPELRRVWGAVADRFAALAEAQVRATSAPASA